MTKEKSLRLTPSLLGKVRKQIALVVKRANGRRRVRSEKELCEHAKFSLLFLEAEPLPRDFALGIVAWLRVCEGKTKSLPALSRVLAESQSRVLERSREEVVGSLFN